MPGDDSAWLPMISDTFIVRLLLVLVAEARRTHCDVARNVTGCPRDVFGRVMVRYVTLAMTS